MTWGRSGTDPPCIYFACMFKKTNKKQNNEQSA